MQRKAIEVDEDLPNFFEAIKLKDADWFAEENKYLEDNYKFTFAEKEVVNRIDETPIPKKPV